MNRKRALGIVLELACENSLTLKEVQGNVDLMAQMQEQDVALMLVAELIDEEGE